LSPGEDWKVVDSLKRPEPLSEGILNLNVARKIPRKTVGTLE
jgi:hypothetical protein